MKIKNRSWVYAIWIFLIIISYSWNDFIIESNTLKVVENKAQSFFSQILLTRSWNSMHGGVYVPVTDKTRPNPYLIDDVRDVETLDGLKLTKVNPAYMTRQIAEMNKSENDLQFHITSLNPIRPANKADVWEAKALNSFKKGKLEILELIKNDTASQYRYIAALITEKSCLKCHEVQGYQLGDIRGGISISFSSKIYIDSQNRQLLHMFFAHFLILIFGLYGIFKYFKMQNKFYAIIKEKNLMLENDGQLLRQSNELLLTANNEKDKFFSIIAHDLRSPFNSFLGLTKIMAEELPDLTMQEIQKYADSMSRSATNLYRLLENLLEWAKMQQGLTPFNPKILQLQSIVAESISIVMETSKQKGIQINYDISHGLEVFADNNMLQTILRNLVSNAVKFTPKGGCVNISARVTNAKVIEIAIKDSGIGMNKNMIENLFKLDVNTNRKGTDGEFSTGLGLIICKDFVEKHGGKLWVESEEANLQTTKTGGSVFYFTLAIENQ